MTSRERVTAALKFERPDRLPVTDALWDGLQQEWFPPIIKTKPSVSHLSKRRCKNIPFTW